MLGYTQPITNDVYIFFENDEIEELERGKIRGTYFNLRDISKTGSLEVSIDDKISEKIDIFVKKDADGFITLFHLMIKTREYSRLKERRTAGSHQGYRHIELLDSNRLNSTDQPNYRQLKCWESQQSQPKT